MKKHDSNKFNEFEIIQSLLLCSDELVDSFPKNDTEHSVLLCAYFLSLYDIVADIQLLVSNNRTNNIPVLSRTFLETFIDFKLINQDSSNIDKLYLKAKKEEKKLLNAVSENNNSTEEERSIFNNAIENVNACLNEISMTNELSIHNKFKDLGLEWEYKTVYNQLCGYAHNDIVKIEQKHIEMNGENNAILKHGINMHEKHLGVSFTVINIYFLDAIKTIFTKLNVQSPQLRSKIDMIETQIRELKNLK